MLNFKNISVAALTVSICAFGSTASAQPSTPALIDAPTAPTAEAAPRAMPKLFSTKTAVRKVKRVVKAVPIQASAAQLQQKTLKNGVYNANSSKETAPTRFVYSRRKHDINMRVLFNADSLNAR